MKKGKNKIQINFGSKHIYEYYCKTTKNPYNLSRTDFGIILKDFWKELISKMIYENYEIVFPSRLGSFRILKHLSKPKLKQNGELSRKNLSIDYDKTRKLWKEMYKDKSMDEIYEIKNKPLIYHQNKHSNGYRYTWVWDKRTCLVKNAAFYKLDICRANDRTLSKASKEKQLNFYTFK